MDRRRIAISLTSVSIGISGLGLFVQILSLLLFGFTSNAGRVYVIAMALYFLGCCVSWLIARKKAEVGIVLSSIIGIVCVIVMVLAYAQDPLEEGYPSILMLLCLGVIAPGIVIGWLGVTLYTSVCVAFCLWMGIVFNDLDKALVSVALVIWVAATSWIIGEMAKEQVTLQEGVGMFREFLEAIADAKRGRHS